MKQLYQSWKTHCLRLMDDQVISTKIQYTTLMLVLLGCIIIRLIIIDVPPIERTMWKEIDYIEISKNYMRNGYNFFTPEISWPAEPPRTTAMELPLVPYAASLLYALFGFNVYTVRLLTLCAFIIMTFYVFQLGRRELGPLVGLGAAMASAIMPLYHTFRHILFSDPWVIALSVMALYHLAQWVDFRKKKDWFLAMAAFSLAVSLKLTPLYLLLPLTWIVFRKDRLDFERYRKFALMIACSLILPLLWYAYAYYLTKTSIDVFGIFGGHDKMQTFTMLSDPNWHKVMFQRLRWQILGGKPGILLCMVGVGSALLLRKGGLFFFYLAAIMAFFAIVAEGHIDAPYRQMTIIPPLSLFIGISPVAVISIGLSILNDDEMITDLNIIKSLPVLIIVCCFSLSIFIYNRHDIMESYPNDLYPVEKLAKKITTHIEDGSKIIALGEYTIHKGGNDLSPKIYYYSKTQGWTLEKGQWSVEIIEKLINKGATLLAARKISREPGLKAFVKKLMKEYKVFYWNEKEELLLLDLKN